MPELIAIMNDKAGFEIASISITDEQRDLIDGLKELGFFSSRGEGFRFILFHEYLRISKGEYSLDYSQIQRKKTNNGNGKGWVRDPEVMSNFKEESKKQRKEWLSNESYI
ncbi:MAG: hypothetical protein U9Q73_01825 [Nanoarchaeota archaeon]|nr:hypothetical protein [Nanoarchaeota archaeon]